MGAEQFLKCRHRMPLEYRLIHFSEHELEDAVSRWLRAHGELSQYGRAGKLRLSEEDKKVTIIAECSDIKAQNKKGLRRRVMDHEEARQAIVLFCKDNSIPLARRAKKVIRVLDKRIAMYYQFP